jgi:hypothetical protein
VRLFLDALARDAGRRKWEAVPAADRRRSSLVIGAVCVCGLGASALLISHTAGPGIAAFACGLPALVMLPFAILLAINPGAAMKWAAVAPSIFLIGAVAGLIVIVVRA